MATIPPKPPRKPPVPLKSLLNACYENEAQTGFSESRSSPEPQSDLRDTISSPIRQDGTRETHQHRNVIGNRRERYQDDDGLYHKNTISEVWILVTILIHCIQWGLLLGAGHTALNISSIVVLVLMMVMVAALLIYSRWRIRKKRNVELMRQARQRADKITPDAETDSVPNAAIYTLASAAILEALMFAIYSASIAGVSSGHFSSTGFFTRGTLLQTLRFASITFLSFHRCLRPANRIDPMRTVLEVEE